MSDLILKSLDISNFRSIRGHVHAPLDAKVVLVHGENGAGKTSLLSAIELALTGKVQSLERADPSYEKQLLHRSATEGSVLLKALAETSEQSFKAMLNAAGPQSITALDEKRAAFFQERAFLPQALLGQLLQIYQDAGNDAASPLAQFVSKLLGLDRLDALEAGLKPLADVRNVRKIVDNWTVAENDKSRLDRLLADARKTREELNEQVRNTLVELATLCSALELSVEVREETLDDVAAALSNGSDSEAFARLTDQQRRLASIRREIDAAQSATVSNSVPTSAGTEDARAAFSRWEAEYGTRASALRGRVEALLANISLPSDPEQFAEAALSRLRTEQKQLSDRTSQARADIARHSTAQDERDVALRQREHVLCFAPTRSGKGVGLVVPTLLTWPGSAIVHDIKGENWSLTAGWRARFGRVLLFDPTNVLSAAYNPLLEVRRGEWEVRDVQNIADVLVDPEGALERRNHWEKTSHSLLVGAILHVLYAETDKTLAGVANFLSDPHRPIETTLRAMMTTPHLGMQGVHPVVASSARELLNKSDNERSGVLSTAMSFLGLYRDPVVAAVTRQCDWRIRDLVEGKEPATLYLVVPPSDISRTKPLVRLILNQIGRRLTEELESKDRRHRLLLMLDEFPALGRLDFFESALAFMAGYGLKSFLISQSLNQIEKAYGQNNSILDNCHVRVSFATNDERTAKRVSDALGTATEMRAMKNYAGHRLSPWLGHLMVSRQETARPLLTPGEVMQLPPDDELVLVSGCHPIRAKKARYFEDAEMKVRILPPPVLIAREAPIDPGIPKRSDQGDWTGVVVAAPAAASAEDAANAGIRREPELPEHEEIAPAPKSPIHEFEPMEDEPDDEAQRLRVMQRNFGNAVRQVPLDPGDDMRM